MKVSVIGSGYVGLTTGAALASLGNVVQGFDTNQELVESLNEGRLPFYEAGLADLVRAQSAAGRLSFSEEVSRAPVGADLVFICVGTPEAREGGRPDISQVEKAVELIADTVTPRTVVVLKSTVPIGTGDKIALLLSQKSGGLFPADNVAVNPEFLREGSALGDFFQPDRVVLGVEGELAKRRLVELYGWVQAPLVLTDRKTAEAIKYAANAFLATKISFINQIARLCTSLGINAVDVARGIGLDRRIGPDFLEPGVGFGGSCLPKDLAALVFMARAAGARPTLLEAVAEINRSQPEWVISLMEQAMAEKPAPVAVWGLSFKPDTDDTRSSPALALISSLVARGYEVRAYDPMARLGEDPVAAHGEEGRGGRWCRVDSAYDAVAGAHALVLATAWPEFRNADWSRVRRLMAGETPVVVDGRNALEPAALVGHGFVYVSVGRVAGRFAGRAGKQ